MVNGFLKKEESYYGNSENTFLELMCSEDSFYKLYKFFLYNVFNIYFKDIH